MPETVQDGSALPDPAARARSSASALTRATFVLLGEASRLTDAAPLFAGIVDLLAVQIEPLFGTGLGAAREPKKVGEIKVASVQFITN